MQGTNVREIVKSLEPEQLYADFTEQLGRGLNREKYGIYDICASSYGDFMIKFNEAHHSGKLIRYIDLRIPSIDFSQLIFDRNINRNSEEENPEYTMMYQLIQHIHIKNSGLKYDAVRLKFESVMTRPDISVNEKQKYDNACAIYDTINQMRSMGARHTKYVVIPYGYRVSVNFPGNGVERMSFQLLPSNNGQETIKIEMPNVKITEKFNNYSDRTNMMLFEHAKEYMESLPIHKDLPQGTADFDRLRPGYRDLISKIVIARYPATER